METVRKDWAKTFHADQDSSAYINEVLTTKKSVLIRLQQEFLNFFEKGELILDGGCSEGAWCFYLEKQGFRTIGVDFVTDAIRVANRFRKKNGSNSAFIIGDITRLSLRANILDGYISLGVVEHFRSKEAVRKAFDETVESLTIGGKAFFAVPGPFVVFRNILSLVLTGGRIGFYHQLIPKRLMEKYLLMDNMNILKSKYAMGWVGLCNFFDGLLKIVGCRKLRNVSEDFLLNRKPMWLFSGSHVWAQKVRK